MSRREPLLTRRPVLAGLAAVVAAVAAGIGIDLVQPKHKRATGPYAGLVNNLDDPDSAAIIGTAILAHAANKTAAIHEAANFAKDRLKSETLSSALTVDAAQGFLTEVNGWVIPITLGALCVLAAA